MKFFRKALIVLLALLLVLAAWVWWNRPRKVNMAAYVPADSLIYLEANDLPAVISGIISTDAWKALAPPAGIRSDLGRVGWLSRFASWTGIGPADAVVFSRAQVAVTVLGLDAAEAGDTLKIKPRYAVVVETHTGEARARSAIENRVGEFARRAYGEPRVEQKPIDGTQFTTWSAPDGERRIVVAVMGSVAVIGNDEAAVKACLAVRRNERPSLEGNPQLEEMRRRVGGEGALTFGYFSAEGVTRLLELAAPAYAAQVSSDSRAQSALATLLPPLAKKILGGLGWSAHLSEGFVEDRYFLTLQNGVATRLQPALASQQNISWTASGLLPADVYSLTRYNYRDPAQALRGLRTTLASQADTLSAFLVNSFFDALLLPYGIEEPESFFAAVGPEVITAQLDDAGSSTVTVVEVRDEKVLRDFVAKQLGAKPEAEAIGDAELLVSKDEHRRAASFIGKQLIMGRAEHVRRCLEARRTNQTLDAEFKRTGSAFPAGTANVVTLTEDRNPAKNFITAVAAQRGTRAGPFNEAELEEAARRLRFAVTETQIVDGGFERRTRSAFGRFGTLASQFLLTDAATPAR